MALYATRQEAGDRLAQELAPYYRGKDVIVIGLPRGGVLAAYGVANALHVPLDILAVRKIGAPTDPELAIGAVDHFRHATWNNALISELEIPLSYLEEEAEKGAKEAQRRMKLYRGARPPLNLNNKRVIIVDDGIATGYTVIAAVKRARLLGAKKVVVATPVGARNSIEHLKQYADKVVCLYVPRLFLSVGQFYSQFPQLSDRQVIDVLKEKDPQNSFSKSEPLV